MPPKKDALTEGGPRKKRKIASSTNTAIRRVTRLMTLDSARRAVFDTNELLENILSHLPFSELFMLQRVSQQWRGVITSSPGLQEKMFLRPQSATPEETWILENYDYHDPFTSIGIYRRHVNYAGAPRFRRNDGSKTTRGKLLVPLTLNPIFSLVDRHPIAASGRVCLRDYELQGVARTPAIERCCISLSDTVSICMPPGALHRNCSMWKLFFSDPSCQVAEVKLTVRFQGVSPSYGPRSGLSPDTGFRVTSTTGLTIGDILTAASESTKFNCCEFDNGYMWKDLRTELEDMIDGTEQRSGWTGVYDVEDITLYIDLLQHENRPLVVTEEDRVAVATEEDCAAVTGEEPQAAVVTD